ncbi:MAG: toxin-antitoxin system HicB family antitoxin [Gammaproteobacteria bacterium]|nr:toxin-antitoxin system HicB family antitoxin [Gammaproteobacteria bacterium]
MKVNDYPVNITPIHEEDGGGYLAIFPDLPGCMADGESAEDAVHQALDAAESWLQTAIEFGDPIPEPHSGGESGKFITRAPRSLHARLKARAIQEGVSMNTLVVSLLSEKMSAT